MSRRFSFCDGYDDCLQPGRYGPAIEGPFEGVAALRQALRQAQCATQGPLSRRLTMEARGCLPPFTPYKFYMKFTAYCLLPTAYFPIFSTQKFLTRILLWQRLLFSVTVTSVAVWNAP